MPSRFRPAVKPKLIDPIKSERLRRVIRSYNDVHQQYIPNKMEDKAELETSLYKQRYPDNVERELKTLIRVKVPKGSFELENGIVDEKGTVTEALVYTIAEKVINEKPDPDKGDSDVYAYCSTKMGIYKKPIAIVKMDSLGNPVSSKITGHKAMFYISFTEKNVRKILDEIGGESKGFSLAEAQKNSSDRWYGNQTYSVYNLDEFIHSKFEDVLGANKGGFLKDKIGRVVEYGAVDKYIMDKAAKREQAEKEFKDFKEKQQRQTKGK
ncbi:MAG: hypothetical protein WA941_00750 [Nitrososphaeraceae archaeon]